MYYVRQLRLSKLSIKKYCMGSNPKRYNIFILVQSTKLTKHIYLCTKIVINEFTVKVVRQS